MKTFSIVLFLMIAVPAWAHHSTAVTFDVDKPQTLTGTITKIQFQNPHVLVSVDSASNGGPQQH